jgi:mRNA interferase MazF
LKYPRRGEVWLIDLGMTAKVRPCVAISVPIADEDRAIVTLVPRTTSTRGTKFEVPVPVPFLKPGAFDAQGLVTVPVSRALRLLGTLDELQMRTVEAAVCKWLGLPCAPL